MSNSTPRRMGDEIAISGGYQHRVLTQGWAPQRAWHDFKYREAARWLAPQPGERLLDVGCGSGVLADRLAADPAVQVTGVDNNPDAIRYASQTFQRPNLEYRLGLVDELAFEPESIHRIVFLEVLEHIYPQQARQVFGEFQRLLAPGGRLVITTPNARSLWPAIEWLLDRSGLVPVMEDSQHVALYSRARLAALAKDTGYRVVEIRSLNFIAPWLAVLGRGAAEAAHRLEQARGHALGSLLLGVFEKPA